MLWMITLEYGLLMDFDTKRVPADEREFSMWGKIFLDENMSAI
jgi:hypothetical protein